MIEYDYILNVEFPNGVFLSWTLVVVDGVS